MKFFYFICCLFLSSPTWAKEKKSNLVLKTRAPSESKQSLEVYSESTSFEKLVLEERIPERKPASLLAKARVISVRRELPMSRAEEKLITQEFVINAGSNAGLAEGMKLRVMRKMPIIDPYLANRQRELRIKFATVKLIHVQEDLAIAKMEALDPFSESLKLDIRGVAVGDYIAQK